MEKLWDFVLGNASKAEGILIGILIYLWMSHRDLVNDLRDEVKKRRGGVDDIRG